MTLIESARRYDEAKKRILPVLAKQRCAIPIFRLEQDLKGLFAGNGFFLNEKGELSYQHSTNGWNGLSTPLELYKAFKLFHQPVTARQASDIATQSINCWYSRLN